MSKSAIILSVVSPTPGTAVSLTTLCGGQLPPGGWFKGRTAMAPTNVGANYLVATVAGAGNMPANADEGHDWSAVNGDTLLFLMANGTDLININGELVEGGSAH
jgi:hypothetical protein